MRGLGCRQNCVNAHSHQYIGLSNAVKLRGTSAEHVNECWPHRLTRLLCSRSMRNRGNTAMHSSFDISLSERSMASNWFWIAHAHGNIPHPVRFRCSLLPSNSPSGPRASIAATRRRPSHRTRGTRRQSGPRAPPRTATATASARMWSGIARGTPRPTTGMAARTTRRSC